MSKLKGIKHPSLPQSVKNGAIIFGISLIGAGIITGFDLLVTSIIKLFI